MPEAFFQAAIALAIAWGVAVWVVFPLLKARGDVTTRVKRGQQFASYAATCVLAVTGARAITTGSDVNRIMAVLILTPLAWAAAFGVGWLIGPGTVTPTEEQWALASAEFSSENRREGLWAKVLVEAKGNEANAKAAYIRQRASELARNAPEPEGKSSNA